MNKSETEGPGDCQSLTHSKTGCSRDTTMPQHCHVFYGTQFLWTTYSEMALHSLRSFSSVFLNEKTVKKTGIWSCDFVTRQLSFGKRTKSTGLFNELYRGDNHLFVVAFSTERVLNPKLRSLSQEAASLGWHHKGRWTGSWEWQHISIRVPTSSQWYSCVSAAKTA